jgi:hypothetical protein
MMLPGYELIGRSLRSVLGMDHEEHVREAGAEVSSVCVVMLRRFWRVNVETFRAVELDHGLTWHVRQT